MLRQRIYIINPPPGGARWISPSRAATLVGRGRARWCGRRTIIFLDDLVDTQPIPAVPRLWRRIKRNLQMFGPHGLWCIDHQLTKREGGE